MRRRTIISTDIDVPLRKRVTKSLTKFSRRTLPRFGKKAAKFLNRQSALIIIAFFILSLNVVSSPLSIDPSTVNPLINYNPDALAQASTDINPYIPILQSSNAKDDYDQVLSAVVGPENTFSPTPMLVATIDSQTADRIRRGLRKETVYHKVEQGETLGKIASDYGVNVATLLDVNGLKAEDTLSIKPGRELTIPPEKTTDSVAWLDSLHEAERARLEKERAKQAQIAAANNAKKSRKGQIAVAQAADDGDNSGQFIRPVPAAGGNGYHWWATDHPTPIGSAVVAPASGVVRIADDNGWNGGYGKEILIDHGNGWSTRVAHLSSVRVNVGEHVSAGEVIALSGNSGRSTGPHVHFEILKGGTHLNPCGYIKCQF